MIACPRPECAGQLRMTVSLHAGMVGESSVVGAELSVPSRPAALVACPDCHWAAHGWLLEAQLQGGTFTAGYFVPDSVGCDA